MSERDGTNHPAESSDESGEGLGGLLEDAVADVEPRDDLEAIMARTEHAPGASRAWVAAAATAAVTAAAAVAAVMVLDAPDAVGPAGPRPPGGQTQTPTPSSTPSSPSSSTRTPAPRPQGELAAPGASGALPVYYPGQTSRGLRLFREFHADPGGGDPLRRVMLATREAVSLLPADPDYRLVWPSGTLVEGGSLVQGLGGAPTEVRVGLQLPRGASMGPRQLRTGLQQVAWTVRAVVGDPMELTVRLSPDPVTGRRESIRVTPRPAADVLAQVWVIDPPEGSDVDAGDRVRVSGLAAAFEGTVPWRLVRGTAPSGPSVRSGFTTTAGAGRMSPYAFSVRTAGLVPGDYLLVVTDSDPSGGEGFAPWRDTKVLHVH